VPNERETASPPLLVPKLSLGTHVRETLFPVDARTRNRVSSPAFPNRVWEREVYFASMQYRNLSPLRKSCFPTTTGDASIGSSSRFVASTSSSLPCLSTSVVPSRPVM